MDKNLSKIQVNTDFYLSNDVSRVIPVRNDFNRKKLNDDDLTCALLLNIFVSILFISSY